MHVRLLSQAAWLLIVLSLLPACQSAPPPAAAVPTQPVVVPAEAVPTTAVPASTQPATVPAGATATPRAVNTTLPSATPAVSPPTAVVAATATQTVRPTDAPAKPTATATRPTATPTARPTNTPTARPTATPSPTREPSTRNLYSAQMITHGGALPSLVGDKGDDYLYTAERFPQGCRIVSVMAIEYTGDKPSAPAPSATHAGHGWSVVRQNDDPRDLGVHLHWWFNSGFREMKLRVVYVVRQDWNVDCAIPGRTQDGF